MGYTFIPFNEHNKIIYFTKAYFDYIMQEDDWAELHALYSFYLYTANWQNTTKIWATAKYAQAGLGWGKEKFQKVKNKLTELKLIQTIQGQKKTGGFEKSYIKIYLLQSKSQALKIEVSSGEETNFTVPRFLRYRKKHATVETRAQNAYKENNKENAYKENNSKEEEEVIKKRFHDRPNIDDFEEFWVAYPRKRRGSKGAAFTKWKEIIKRKDCPPINYILRSLEAQKETKKWESGFIPLPTTWLNQQRWMDKPKEMDVAYPQKVEEERKPGITSNGRYWSKIEYKKARKE
jgi:hypothetical protein